MCCLVQKERWFALQWRYNVSPLIRPFFITPGRRLSAEVDSRTLPPEAPLDARRIKKKRARWAHPRSGRAVPTARLSFVSWTSLQAHIRRRSELQRRTYGAAAY